MLPKTSLTCATLALLFIFAGACSGGGGDDDDHDPSEEEGDDPNECSDGVDNDDNGLYDCDDPDCAASPDCQEGDDDDSTSGDDDDSTPPGDDDDSTPPGDDDDSTQGDDDDTGSDDVWFEVCNVLDGYEDIWFIYSWAPGDSGWVTESSSTLSWGACTWIGPYWPDYWTFRADDEFGYEYCTELMWVGTEGATWDVTYSFDCGAR